LERILRESAAIVRISFIPQILPLFQQSPWIDKAAPEHMVGKHKGNPGFGNRHHTRRNCGIVPPFDRDFGVFPVCKINGLLNFSKKRFKKELEIPTQ